MAKEIAGVEIQLYEDIHGETFVRVGDELLNLEDLSRLKEEPFMRMVRIGDDLWFSAEQVEEIKEYLRTES